MGTSRRLIAALLLAGAALLGGATSASAIDLPNPIGDAILDKICPPRQAPYPGSPEGTVLSRGGGAGVYANYGYAGLRWTTYDAGCLSWDKADTSIGTQINGAANAVDALVNELQVAALDNATTTSFDTVIARALAGLRDAFWNPWSLLGLGVAGALMVLYALSGRETDAWALVGSAAVVLVLVSTVLARPSLITDASNGMTSGVAQGVSSALVRSTPSSPGMPDSATPVEKFGEGFYQVSHQAWLEGEFCGHADAAAVYGPRLLDAQAFTVRQVREVEDNPEAAERLVKAKQAAWLRIGAEMSKTHPVAFGCWKGEGTSRTGAAVKHAVVTLSAGLWVSVGSVALLALKWVLRLAMLFLVTFGALMLFSARMRDRMTEFVLLGLLGPPFVAAAVGTLLWGYYAILLTRGQAWWMSAVTAFALGVALWMSTGVLKRLFVGMHSVDRARSVIRRGGRRVQASFSGGGGHGGGGGAHAAGAALGGVAGAALVHHDVHDDAPRSEHHHTHEEESMRTPDDPLYGDAPAQALERAREMVLNARYQPSDAGREAYWQQVPEDDRDVWEGRHPPPPTDQPRYDEDEARVET